MHTNQREKKKIKEESIESISIENCKTPYMLLCTIKPQNQSITRNVILKKCYNQAIVTSYK